MHEEILILPDSMLRNHLIDSIEMLFDQKINIFPNQFYQLHENHFIFLLGHDMRVLVIDTPTNHRMWQTNSSQNKLRIDSQGKNGFFFHTK